MGRRSGRGPRGGGLRRTTCSAAFLKEKKIIDTNGWFYISIDTNVVRTRPTDMGGHVSRVLQGPTCQCVGVRNAQVVIAQFQWDTRDRSGPQRQPEESRHLWAT